MKSEQIQLEGECEVSVESEPVIVTGKSYRDQHATEIQSIINPMAEDEFEKDNDPDEDDEGCTAEEADAMMAEDTGIDQEGPYDDDEDDEDAIRDIPTALSSQIMKRKQGRPKKSNQDTDIQKRYGIRKMKGSPTPIVDFTRSNKIPYQDFMDEKWRREKD